MTAYELRIGNLVTDEFYDSFHTIIIVESINDNGINLEIEDDGNYPEIARKWIEPYYNFDFIKPIPLTEEWLVKFGFKKDEIGVFVNICYKQNLSIGLNLVGDKYCIVYLTGSFGMVQPKHIKSVHQLQNLYFALTGEELTLKEQ